MKAFVYKNKQFMAKEVAKPDKIGKTELLIKVKAVAFNPIEYKLANLLQPDEEKIFGSDGCGVVEAVGDEVELFNIGDEVMYSWDHRKAGSHSEYQVVSQYIAAKKPTNLSYEQSACVPLTAVTAWELLFDRMRLEQQHEQQTPILVINGAGGVGSMVIQLASLAGYKVIATASKEEGIAWCTSLGANAVLNHKAPLLPQLKEIGIETLPYIACLYNPDSYGELLEEAIAPQGVIGLIVDNEKPLRMQVFKKKSITLCWEMMFTRIAYKSADLIKHHQALAKVSAYLQQGKLQPTMTKALGRIDVQVLDEALNLLISQKQLGKISAVW